MYTAALFTVTKTWKQPTCPLTDEWIKKLWCIYTVEYYHPEYSLEGLTLKLKLQYFDHLMWELTHWKRPWCWERLKAGAEGDDRGWHGWMTSLTQWTWVWVNSGSWWWAGRPGMLPAVHGVAKSWRQLSHWTELNWTEPRVRSRTRRPVTKWLTVWAWPEFEQSWQKTRERACSWIFANLGSNYWLRPPHCSVTLKNSFIFPEASCSKSIQWH